MQLLSFLYPALLAGAALLTPVSGAAKKNAILLSKVKSLTLRDNAMTSHRRVSAIPQLTCKGPACRHHKIEIMRCTNTGSSYSSEDIQWSCSASLPTEFKLGSTDVICEGYDSSDDDYVLKGSCGVEYRLLLTDEGEEKYGKSWFGSSSKNSNVGDDNGWTLDGILFAIIFVGVAIWIIWAAYRGAQDGGRRIPPRAGGGGGGWGGGGGGGDGWDDPPPPYSGPKRYSSTRSEAGGWRPGFWSGAAGGAAAGYMAGRAGNRQPEVQQRGGGWFGGGNSGSPFAGPSRSSSGSSSTARHESTGFGSTSRR